MTILWAGSSFPQAGLKPDVLPRRRRSRPYLLTPARGELFSNNDSSGKLGVEIVVITPVAYLIKYI